MSTEITKKLIDSALHYLYKQALSDIPKMTNKQLADSIRVIHINSELEYDRALMLEAMARFLNHHGWFVSALNETREYCRYSCMLELDADEVLSDSEETHYAVRHAMEHCNAYAFNRLNFVRDASSLIPEGECVGKWVVRIGPSHLWMPSDEPHDRGEVHLLDMACHNPKGVIFHLGFLRQREAYFAKARVLGAFFGEFDERLARAERDGAHPFAEFPWWNRLTPYSGYYPDSVRKWMTERGYVVPPNV